MSQRSPWLPCVVFQIGFVIVLDVQCRTVFVDTEKTGAALPTPQDYQAWPHESVVGGLVNMADHHQIGRAAAPGCVRAKDFHVAFFVGLKPAEITRLEDPIKCLGDRPGNVRKSVEKQAGFHPRLPDSSRSQKVAVDDADAQSVQSHIVRFDYDPCPQLGLVERAKPLVMIAGHDRQRAPSPPEFGQGLQALEVAWIVMLAVRTHPEIAKIAGNHQGIVGRQSV